MNKVFLLSTTLLISQQGFSESLDCTKYSNLFKNQAYQNYALAKSAGYEQYRKFGQQTDYSYLFKDKHPGQLYRGGAWNSEKDALEMSKITYDFQRQGIINNFKIQVLAPKGSYQSQYGDVCIMPIKGQYSFLDVNFESHYDAIMVRHPKTKSWRVFIYLGIEKQKDMAEFFPDFPAEIKLSPASYNGMNYAESSDFNIRHYYEFYHLAINEEQEANLKKSKQDYLDALKANGFIE